MARTSSLTIRTGEGIFFTLFPAGPVARFVAWAVDMACVFAVLIPLNVVLRFFVLLSGDVAQAAGIVSYFVVSTGYAIWMEWRFRGQTVGKKLLSLRVMDAGALPLQPGQIVIRNCLRIIDSLPLFYLVGGISCLLTRNFQRLGDLAGGTVVVRERKAQNPDFQQIGPVKYNSLREHPIVAARLRQRTSPREAEIALQAVLRREEMDPSARVAVFGEIADHFKRSVPLPPEITAPLSAEQLVRDVVEVLYNPGRN